MATRNPTPDELERAAATLPVVLFDGACRFCVRQAERARGLARGRLLVRPLQEALDALPWVDPDEALRALTLVGRDGRTVAGVQAIVELLRIARPTLGTLARVYYLPGVRHLADLGYRIVAARRYALFGAAPEHPACDGGACGRPWAARGGIERGPISNEGDWAGRQRPDGDAADEQRHRRTEDQSTSTGRFAASSVRTTTPPRSDSSQRE